MNTFFRGFSSTRAVSRTAVTFFTKDTCSLCINAKVVLNKALTNDKLAGKDIEVSFVDITDPKNKQWWDAYCYDVPVLHVDREGQKQVKFMHRLNEEKLVEEFEK